MLGPPVVLLLGLYQAAPTPEDSHGSALTVDWAAPTGCPDQASVRDEINRLLEGLEAPQGTIHAEIQVHRQSSAWHLDLSLRIAGETGERRFEADTCDELADAVALTIAIAVDPRALDRVVDMDTTQDPGSADAGPSDPQHASAEAELKEEEEEEAEEAEENTSPKEREPGSPRDNDLRRKQIPRIATRVGGGVGLGMLPGPSGNLEIEIAYLGPRWRIGIGGDFWLPTKFDSPNAPDVGGRFSLWTAGVRGCFVPDPTPGLELPLCAGIEGGAMQGEGFGDLEPRTAWGPYVAVRAGIGIAWVPVPSLAVVLHTHGIVPMTRPAFQSEPSGTIYRAKAAGFQALAGIEWRIPTRRGPSEH